MYIAMNRFKVRRGEEETFIEIWRQRETHLDQVPGFRSFALLQGPSAEAHTLFASHSTWDDAAAFEAWTHSEAFRLAHRQAGGRRDIYLGPPCFEGFTQVL